MPYYHRITEADKQKAFTELREDENEVGSHIESLRRWVQAARHLHCPINDRFLLMFLRIAKFDHFQAQRRLDNFCTIRASEIGLRYYFRYPNVNDENVKVLLESMLFLPLGRLETGEMVIIYRPGQWDPEKVPLEGLIPIMFMWLDVMIQNERSIINGIISIIDCVDCDLHFFDTWQVAPILKNVVRILQECYPLRMKSQIVYNEPILFHALYEIAYFYLNVKQRKRTFRVANHMSEIFPIFPGLQRLLPNEYGGDGKSIKEYNDDWIKELQLHYSKGNPLEEIKVDESKRRKAHGKYLLEYADYES